jgi:hypothetical protein
LIFSKLETSITSSNLHQMKFNTVTHYCNWQLGYLGWTHKNIRIIFDFKIIKLLPFLTSFWIRSPLISAIFIRHTIRIYFIICHIVNVLNEVKVSRMVLPTPTIV